MSYIAYFRSRDSNKPYLNLLAGRLNDTNKTVSVDVACLSSDISVVSMPVKTIPELFGRTFWVLPETGVAEMTDRDNLG